MSLHHDAPEFFDTLKAAEYLNIQPQTLNAWRCLRRYPLPYTKVGRSIRYKKSDLDRFIASRTVSSPAPELATA